MANYSEEINQNMYNYLHEIAVQKFGADEADDLTGTAVLNTLMLRQHFPGKSIERLLQESLGIAAASMYFLRTTEKEGLTKLKNKGYDELTSILRRNIGNLSDMERVIAQELMEGTKPEKIADKHKVSESCIKSYIGMISDGIEGCIYQ